MTILLGGIPVEPYGFIFDRDDRDPTQDVPLLRNNYKSYAPIMSFYSSERFADIPIPPSEDWEAVTGAVFPSSYIYHRARRSKKKTNKNDDVDDDKIDEIEVAEPRDLFTAANLQKFQKPWKEKIPTAFFRGELLSILYYIIRVRFSVYMYYLRIA